MDEETLPGGTALTSAKIRRLEGRLTGELEVCVLEHHHRPIAAELEELGLAGRPLGHTPACGDRADEADGVDVRVGDHTVANDSSRSGEEVEYASRHSGTRDYLGKQARAGRGRRAAGTHTTVLPAASAGAKTSAPIV